MYRCTTASEFITAINDYNNKSILDPIIKRSISEIRGFIVDWPKELLSNDDLSPCLATRAIIPNEMWV